MSEIQNKEQVFKHNLNLEARKHLNLTGVKDVESFDENAIIAALNNCDVIIKGSNLQINNLNIDNGNLSVDGTIDSISYVENMQTKSSGLLNKLFK